MKRNEFLQKGLMATGALIMGNAINADASAPENPQSIAEGKTFNLNYGPHDGMFKNTAGDNFLDQIQYMYDQGFRGIEDNGMSGRSPQEQEKIGNLLAKLGMSMGVFVLNKGGNGANTLAAGKQENIDIFLKGCKDAVEISKRCGGKFTTVVPGDFHRNLSLDLQTAHVIDALRKGAEILEPHNIVMVLEPLSDTPELFLRTSNQTYLICRGVNSPSCKILYDIYHMQRNEGDLIANMERTWSEIAYIQTGDNPGRKEPTTGEINYKNIFKYLHQKGYKGVVGMEHGVSGKGKEGEGRVIAAYREVDAFM
jgi:hydroxypyruvate isomerase